MTFDLLPSIAPWIIGFIVIAAGAAVAAVALTASTLVQTRGVRVARHESVRTYYGRLVLGH